MPLGPVWAVATGEVSFNYSFNVNVYLKSAILTPCRKTTCSLNLAKKIERVGWGGEDDNKGRKMWRRG